MEGRCVAVGASGGWGTDWKTVWCGRASGRMAGGAAVTAVAGTMAATVQQIRHFGTDVPPVSLLFITSRLRPCGITTTVRKPAFRIPDKFILN